MLEFKWTGIEIPSIEWGFVLLGVGFFWSCRVKSYFQFFVTSHVTPLWIIPHILTLVCSVTSFSSLKDPRDYANLSGATFQVKAVQCALQSWEWGRRFRRNRIVSRPMANYMGQGVMFKANSKMEANAASEKLSFYYLILSFYYLIWGLSCVYVLLFTAPKELRVTQGNMGW